MAALVEGRHSFVLYYFISIFGQCKLRYSPKVTFNESCGLQVAVAPKIPSTTHCRSENHQKRNPQPWLYICFLVQPYGWVLFFIFYYIIYYIYKYTIYTLQKTYTNKSCGLRFRLKSSL